MEVVYLETSFISLLVGNPSRDLITAANQQVTRDWWRLRREQFVCVASSEVAREASQGDPQEALKRQSVLSQLTILPFSAEADRMMRALLAARVLPPKAQADAGTSRLHRPSQRTICSLGIAAIWRARSF